MAFLGEEDRHKISHWGPFGWDNWHGGRLRIDGGRKKISGGWPRINGGWLRTNREGEKIKFLRLLRGSTQSRWASYGRDPTLKHTRSEELEYLAANLMFLKDPTTGDQKMVGKHILADQSVVNTVGAETTEP